MPNTGPAIQRWNTGLKKLTKKKTAGSDERRMQQVFHALSAPPRRAILKFLAASSLTAGEISSRFAMAKPSVSQHLTILETAGLVSRNKRGQYVHYALVKQTVETALLGFLAEVDVLPLPSEGKPSTRENAPGPAAEPTRKPGAAAETDLLPAEKPAPAQMSMF